MSSDKIEHTPPTGWPALIGRRVSGMTTDGRPAEGELLHAAEHYVEVLCVDGVVRFLIKHGLVCAPPVQPGSEMRRAATVDDIEDDDPTFLET